MHGLYAGDHAAVEKYIAESGISNIADIIVDTEYGYTPLMIAALYGTNNSTCGYYKTFKLLLPHCATPNATNHAGEAVLMIAARVGNDRAVRKLLKIPTIDVTIQNSLADADTALTIAVSKQHHIIVKCLAKDVRVNCNQKIDGDETALMQASFAGDLESVKILVKYGGDRIDLNTVDSLGKTALMLAITASQHQVIKHLLHQSSIDTTIVAHTGKDALAYAIETHNHHVVSTVLDNAENIIVTEEHMRLLSEIRMHTVARERIYDLLIEFIEDREDSDYVPDMSDEDSGDDLDMQYTKLDLTGDMQYDIDSE